MELRTIETGKWINFKAGNIRYGVVFQEIKTTESGEEYRYYSFKAQRSSKSTSGGGVIRLSDGQIFDYVSKSGEFKTQIESDVIEAILNM